MVWLCGCKLISARQCDRGVDTVGSYQIWQRSVVPELHVTHLGPSSKPLPPTVYVFLLSTPTTPTTIAKASISTKIFRRIRICKFWTGIVGHEVLLPILLVRVRLEFYTSSGEIIAHVLFSDPWPIVSLAYFLRYPNPYAAHVISCDVISRFQTASGTLVTTRLILKRGNLPRWFPQGMMSKTESWIIEESEVDPFGRIVNCRTRNLDHVKIMRVEESVQFRQTPEGYECAAFSASVWILNSFVFWQKNASSDGS